MKNHTRAPWISRVNKVSHSCVCIIWSRLCTINITNVKPELDDLSTQVNEENKSREKFYSSCSSSLYWELVLISAIIRRQPIRKENQSLFGKLTISSSCCVHRRSFIRLLLLLLRLIAVVYSCILLLLKNKFDDRIESTRIHFLLSMKHMVICFP